MQTIHQAKIEGHGSLNFSRVPSGLIEVNLTAPDGGPKHNGAGTREGKLQDSRIIASLDPDGIGALIDYLKQFDTRLIVNESFTDRMAAKHLRRVIANMIGASSESELECVSKNLDMALDIPEADKTKMRGTIELLKSTTQYAD